MDGDELMDRALLISEMERLGIPPEKVQAFMAADLTAVRSPWSVLGMEQLVARIDAAAREGKPVLLFGDFDTDGITATAVLFATLARRVPSASRYNPWLDEGYGLRVEQVERFAADGIRVIITIDNGIAAHAAVERARALGIETLIIDHHLPRSDIGPPPTVYVDPPDHVLSASQVGYLAAQALREMWWGQAAHDDGALALAAVGAQMDWMPLNVAENRGWVAHAQQVINSSAGTCPPGLAALRRELSETFTTSDLLSLGSPLNLAKRSKSVDPNLIVELLLPDTPDARRGEIAAYLVEGCQRVEQQEQDLYRCVLSELDQLRDERGMLIYLLEPSGDLPEMEGPLANYLTQATGRPALVLRRSSGGVERIVFSGRAAGTFSFASFIDDAGLQSIVLGMGGHAKAMGGSFKPDRLDDFIAAVRAWEKATQGCGIWQDTTSPAVPPRDLPKLSPMIAYTLGRRLGPFGHRFRRPVYRAALKVRGGIATSGTNIVHADLPLEDGTHDPTFTFDEVWCDGEQMGININSSESCLRASSEVQ